MKNEDLLKTITPEHSELKEIIVNYVGNTINPENENITVENIIDVGTGPGLPGIPLAILNPDINFTLLDSNGKKTRFLFQAINDLGLKNAKEINQRVEAYQPNHPFDIVLSRAFSAISDMLTQCDHLVSDSGCFLAMKGKKPDSELSQIAKGYKVVDLLGVNVPQIDSERHLIKIIKTGDAS